MPQTLDGSTLEVVNDFKYLGAWIGSSQDDIQNSKALAWKSCNALSKIWMSNLSRYIKIRLFQATVESVLVYGAETWNISSKIQKSLDGCYSMMLRGGAAINVSLKEKMTNKNYLVIIHSFH